MFQKSLFASPKTQYSSHFPVFYAATCSLDYYRPPNISTFISFLYIFSYLFSHYFTYALPRADLSSLQDHNLLNQSLEIIEFFGNWQAFLIVMQHPWPNLLLKVSNWIFFQSISHRFTQNRLIWQTIIHPLRIISFSLTFFVAEDGAFLRIFWVKTINRFPIFILFFEKSKL